VVIKDCDAMSNVGCVACSNHEKDCVWCKADHRCVPNTAIARCSDSTLPTRLAEDCIYISKATKMIWLLFLVLLFIILTTAIIGKFLTMLLRHSPRYIRRKEQCKRAETVTSMLITSSIGSVISILIYFVVNESLIEISLSPFYAFFFGMILLFVGLILIWQSLTYYFEGSTTSFSQILILGMFALLVIASGVICFLLEKDWTHSLSVQKKIPLYAVLGISIAFSLVYSSTDMFQHLFLHCSKTSQPRSPPLAATHVRLLSLTAAVCGLYYGYVFGKLDSEDVNRTSFKLFIQKENFYCYPIAAILGGVSAFYVHYSSVSPMSQKLELTSYVENQGDDL